MLEGAAPSLGPANDLFLQGRYSDALGAVRSEPASSDRALLMARILLRQNDFRNVRTVVAEARAGGLFNDDASRALSSGYDLFAAAALNTDDVDGLAAVAASRIDRMPAVRGEVEYHIAAAYWMTGNNRAASIVNRYLSGHHAATPANVIARFRLLKAWQFATQAQYVHQATAIIQTLRELFAAPERDVGLCASAAQSLCSLARDLHIPRAVSMIVDTEETLPWSADLAVPHLQVLRMLGWTRAMQGDYITAIRHMRGAARLADGVLARPSDVHGSHEISALLVSLDQAWVATISHQDIHAEAALADAAAYLRQDWSTALGDEAAAFVLAAELFAQREPAIAAHALDLARHARARVPRNSAYANDERLGALIDFADALIREARGDRRMARLRAQRAFEVFSAIEFSWRAARCALLLYRVTGEKPWLDAARSGAEMYPRSFIAAEFERFDERGLTPEDQLTPRQREVFELLKRGLSNDEIAAELSCSPHTVRIHKNVIYRVFGVPKRSGLQGLLRALAGSAA